MATPNHPIPVDGRFDADDRVAFDKTAGKFQYEDDNGQEWEWVQSVWIPIVDEDTIKAHQSAYAVDGVDESTPANAVVAREERRAAQKRKKEEKEAAGPGAALPPPKKVARPAQPPAPPKRTAVWVTSLPPTTTVDKLEAVFSKAGVLLVGDDGASRIKLYYDDEGRFKGEALVMYFKEGSVDLAVRLLDETELELGEGMGVMRVRVAEYDHHQKEAGKSKDEQNGKKKEYSAEEKARMTKRIRALQDKVTWHETDDAEDAMLGPVGAVPNRGENRMNRVVVLKYMFKLQDLDKDPALLLELKEDVREEAESIGEVTSVILYDKEEDGVMTVKFRDVRSAEVCVAKMNGRFFDGRKISATFYTGKERYRRSGKGHSALEDGKEDQEEKERLDGFARWLVDGSDGED